MELIQVEIQNFLTIGHAVLTLDKQGLVLLQGQNLDDTSTKSNGAGKSTIPDAVCWASYGVTARDESGDKVVNNKRKKDCRVVLLVKDGDTLYRIARHRKDSEHKNELHVHSWNPIERFNEEAGLKLHKGSDRETQEVVNTIMGCTQEVFMGAIYAGQEKMPDLPGMTDKFLKLMIEEAAGTEKLARAYKLASDEHIAAKRQLDAALTRRDTLVSSKDNTARMLAAAQEEHDSFEANRIYVRDDYMGQSAQIAEEVAELLNKLDGMQEAKVAKGLKLIADKLAGIKPAQDRAKELQTVLMDNQNVVALAQAEVNTKTAAARKAKEAFESVGAQVGQPCSECGKSYEAHDLAELTGHRKKQLTDALIELKTAKDALKVAESVLEAATSAYQAADREIPDLTDLIAKQGVLNGRMKDIENVKAEIRTKTDQAGQFDVKAAEAMTVANPTQTVLDMQQKEFRRVSETLEDCLATIAGLEKDVALKDAACKVFGPAGVRARVLDQVTPFLNDRTSDYLGALSDGNISAVWSTLSTTAKGELREKFNIDVSNSTGGDTFKALSGGEKRKVRLACALALQDLVASRASKPINLFIGDEIDDALDEAGLERLMTILERKARERGTVLVISHNDLADWVDNITTVTKRGGVSTVSGALT